MRAKNFHIYKYRILHLKTDEKDELNLVTSFPSFY